MPKAQIIAQITVIVVPIPCCILLLLIVCSAHKKQEDINDDGGLSHRSTKDETPNKASIYPEKVTGASFLANILLNTVRS